MTRATIRLLVCCTAALPAFAIAQSVTLYGAMMPFADMITTRGASAFVTGERATQAVAERFTGATVPRTARLTSGSSHLGLRGEEPLRAGWRAIFQIESPSPVDGATVPPSLLAGRNTHVGIAGPFGTLFVGNWDTPYKVIWIDIVPTPGLNSFDNALSGNPGFGVPGTTTQGGRVNGPADAAFNRRQGNSVQYWTPEFGGASARLAYSPAENAGAAEPGGPLVRPELGSLAVQWRSGALTVRYAYELHRDYFGMSQLGGSRGATASNPSSRDDAHGLAAVVRFGDTRLSAMVDRLRYRTDDAIAGAVREYRRTAWYALAQQYFGPHQAWVAVGRANDGSCSRVGGAACTTGGLAGVQYSAGYQYAFSRRTNAYVAYYGMRNDASASYATLGQPAAPGADTRGAGIGLMHIF